MDLEIMDMFIIYSIQSQFKAFIKTFFVCSTFFSLVGRWGGGIEKPNTFPRPILCCIGSFFNKRSRGSHLVMG